MCSNNPETQPRAESDCHAREAIRIAISSLSDLSTRSCCISKSCAPNSHGVLHSFLLAMAIRSLKYLSWLHLCRILYRTRRRGIFSCHRKDSLPRLPLSTNFSLSPSSYFRTTNDLHLPSRLSSSIPIGPFHRCLNQASTEARTSHHLQLPR